MGTLSAVQIDPATWGGVAANRLITSSAAVAFSSRMVDAPLKPRLDDPLTKHILNIEKIVLLLLRS
jgi:hypothetical protein